MGFRSTHRHCHRPSLPPGQGLHRGSSTRTLDRRSKARCTPCRKFAFCGSSRRRSRCIATSRDNRFGSLMTCPRPAGVRSSRFATDPMVAHASPSRFCRYTRTLGLRSRWTPTDCAAKTAASHPTRLPPIRSPFAWSSMEPLQPAAGDQLRDRTRDDRSSDKHP